MLPSDIVQHVRRRPFQPFRMFVSDGTIYDIRHPEMCMVGMGSVIVGVSADPNAVLFERTVWIDCHHVVRIEQITPTAPTGNGPPPALTA
jgi:hypothetical protein